MLKEQPVLILYALMLNTIFENVFFLANVFDDAIFYFLFNVLSIHVILSLHKCNANIIKSLLFFLPIPHYVNISLYIYYASFQLDLVMIIGGN